MMAFSRLLIVASLLYSSHVVVVASSNTQCQDASPDALTNLLGLNIPQTCLSNSKRCFYYYAPQCASQNSPVLYDLHDAGSCAVQQALTSGWLELATEQCFVVVWPMGNMPGLQDDSQQQEASCWIMPGDLTLASSTYQQTLIAPVYDCKLQKRDPYTDLDFLNELHNHFTTDITVQTNRMVSLDSRRMYVSGQGNGCSMAHSMAAQYSDKVTAVACMGGTWISPQNQYIDRRVPTWMIVGALDDTMHRPANTQNSFNIIVKEYECTNVINTSTDIPAMDLPDFPKAGSLVSQKADGCRNGADVHLLTLATAGHELYKETRTDKGGYVSSTTIDTTALAWQFLSNYVTADHYDENHTNNDEGNYDEPVMVLQRVNDEDDANSKEYVPLWQGLRGIF